MKKLKKEAIAKAEAAAKDAATRAQRAVALHQGGASFVRAPVQTAAATTRNHPCASAFASRRHVANVVTGGMLVPAVVRQGRVRGADGQVREAQLAHDLETRRRHSEARRLLPAVRVNPLSHSFSRWRQNSRQPGWIYGWVSTASVQSARCCVRHAQQAGTVANDR